MNTPPPHLLPASAPGTSPSTLALGSGHALLDPDTGAPLQFVDDRAPERTFLLDEQTTAWHTSEFRWGTGGIVTSAGAGRWNAPSALVLGAGQVYARMPETAGIEVSLERSGGRVLREEYRFRNVTSEPVSLTSIGIHTPFSDAYTDARTALNRHVNAHVFTGGSWSWVLAQPMSGEGRLLGLRLTRGQLWGYSVESRNPGTGSNVRGHLMLHVTDHARNPGAFGGQPVITLGPEESYLLEWELGWFDDVDAFLAATNPPATFSRLAARTGEPISIASSAVVRSEKTVRVTATPDGADLNSDVEGTYRVDIGEDARTEVLFHASVEATVRRRCRYVLDHQIARERAGLRRHAIVPVDTATGLSQPAAGWADWSDGSERIGVALLLQLASERGWVDDDGGAALAGWAQFARAHLLDESSAPRRGSEGGYGVRLYDAPWLAWFFLARFRQAGDDADLDLAARVLERALELGIGRFLAIGFSEAACGVADALEAGGHGARATSMRDAVVASAHHFLDLGRDLPGHEVNYEQSMVAPLVALLSDAYRLTRAPELREGIQARLPWLLAFSGPQPHHRLFGVAIRHWDGYWFGLHRQWGDVFPHYWSALTASVLLRLPLSLRTEDGDRLAEAILRANLSNYRPDGSATCAFVMPTAVDGVAGHAADPLANDQDFHLALWLMLESAGYARLV